MQLYGISWDLLKAKSNFEKHGVTFEEAAEALGDLLAVVRSDDTHSDEEDRFILIGESLRGRTVTVIFTIRFDEARIISARAATAAERRRHMETEDRIHDAPLDEDDMKDEYGHLDGWRPNTFRFRHRRRAVILDPDVAEHFETDEEVNDALRDLISKAKK